MVSSGGSSTGGSFGSGGAVSGSGGGGSGSCDGEFGEPSIIDSLSLSGDKWAPSVTEDGLQLYFAVSATFGETIYVAERDDKSDDFGIASPVAGLGQNDYEGTPFVNATTRGNIEDEFVLGDALSSISSPFSPLLLWGHE